MTRTTGPATLVSRGHRALGATVLAALVLCAAGLSGRSGTADAAPAERPTIAAGTRVSVGARLHGQQFPVTELSDANSAQGEVLDLALLAFRRCDDVTRMVLPQAAIADIRHEDHLEVDATPPFSLGLAIPSYHVMLASLVIPLSGQRTRPDWFFYCRSRASESGTWGVYRWRGADPAMVQAVKSGTQRLLASKRILP